MIIECSYCESKVDAKVLAQHEEEEPEGWERYKISLLECPACRNALVGLQEYIQVSQEAFEWDTAVRVWPNPKKFIDWNIPDKVRESLGEASICYKSGVYNACVVMCGKALECICAEYKTESKVLYGGLKELLQKGVIDKRIFEWSEALRLHRNIGAHVSEDKISKADANDLLEFSNAICDYVFVLSKKFEEFLARRKAKSKKEKKSISK